MFSELEQSIDKSILKIYEDPNDHFEPPADIVVYVNEHLTQLIVEGVRDVLVVGFLAGINALWKKLVKRKNKESTIELNFKVKQNKEIEYNLTAVDPKTIEPLTNKMFEYLADKERQEKDFNNPDFKDNNEPKPKIRMKWNREIKDWVPENYAEIRRQHEQWLKTIDKRLHS